MLVMAWLCVSGFSFLSLFQVPVPPAGRLIKDDGQESPDDSSGSSSSMLQVFVHVKIFYVCMCGPFLRFALFCVCVP